MSYTGEESKLEVVTSWSTLFQLARAEAKARESGNVEALEEARQKHDDYRKLCLNPDTKMILSVSIDELVRGGRR